MVGMVRRLVRRTMKEKKSRGKETEHTSLGSFMFLSLSSLS